MQNLPRRQRERQTRENEIVAAAEQVFYRKGYDDASMDEIAREAEFTKKTLYQYFENKEELYLAVVCKGFRDLLERFSAVSQVEICGFEKARRFIFAYYRFYQDCPHTFRLMKYCPFFKDDGHTSAYYQKIEELKAAMRDIFIATVEKGKADGSIRKDLDSTLTAYSLVFFAVGFFYRLSEMRQVFVADEALDKEEVIHLALELLSNTLAPAGDGRSGR